MRDRMDLSTWNNIINNFISRFYDTDYESYKEIILNIFSKKENKDITEETCKSDTVLLNLLGYFYQHIEINYNKMKEYYNLSINRGHSIAMYELGSYYHF